MIRFAKDKPDDCRYCAHWNNRKCNLGGLRNCYYKLPKLKKKSKSPCEGCCYASDHPCIGFCMKNITGEKGGRGR
ncbi:MAG: hypothetical protein Q4C42_08930 [Clostridia bacterium]|nr:hypothetical protein [Clostridia bacterium]